MKKKEIIKSESYDPKTGTYTIKINREAIAPEGNTYAERFKNAILNFLNNLEENKFKPLEANKVQ